MTITTATIISAIKRHLATIGKRLNKEGKAAFTDITLSSAEDTQLLTQYINTSAQDIEAALKMFVTASTYSGSTIVMTITHTRADADFDARVQAMIEAYVTLNTIGEYLSMGHPDLAQKYQADAKQRMETLLAYVIHKAPAQSSAYSYSDITGTIQNA